MPSDPRSRSREQQQQSRQQTTRGPLPPQQFAVCLELPITTDFPFHSLYITPCTTKYSSFLPNSSIYIARDDVLAHNNNNTETTARTTGVLVFTNRKDALKCAEWLRTSSSSTSTHHTPSKVLVSQRISASPNALTTAKAQLNQHNIPSYNNSNGGANRAHNTKNNTTPQSIALLPPNHHQTVVPIPFQRGVSEELQAEEQRSVEDTSQPNANFGSDWQYADDDDDYAAPPIVNNNQQQQQQQQVVGIQLPGSATGSAAGLTSPNATTATASGRLANLHNNTVGGGSRLATAAATTNNKDDDGRVGGLIPLGRPAPTIDTAVKRTWSSAARGRGGRGGNTTTTGGGRGGGSGRGGTTAAAAVVRPPPPATAAATAGDKRKDRDDHRHGRQVVDVDIDDEEGDIIIDNNDDDDVDDVVNVHTRRPSNKVRKQGVGETAATQQPKKKARPAVINEEEDEEEEGEQRSKEKEKEKDAQKVAADAEQVTRDRVRGMLQKGLSNGVEALQKEGVSISVPDTLATEIEAAMFTKYGGTDKHYKEKTRQLTFNLPKNLPLLQNLISGSTAPTTLVELTPDQLKKEDLKKHDELVKERSLKMSVLDGEAAAQRSTAAAVELRRQQQLGNTLSVRGTPSFTDLLGVEEREEEARRAVGVLPAAAPPQQQQWRPPLLPHTTSFGREASLPSALPKMQMMVDVDTTGDYYDDDDDDGDGRTSPGGSEAAAAAAAAERLERGGGGGGWDAYRANNRNEAPPAPPLIPHQQQQGVGVVGRFAHPVDPRRQQQPPLVNGGGDTAVVNNNNADHVDPRLRYPYNGLLNIPITTAAQQQRQIPFQQNAATATAAAFITDSSAARPPRQLTVLTMKGPQGIRLSNISDTTALPLTWKPSFKSTQRIFHVEIYHRRCHPWVLLPDNRAFNLDAKDRSIRWTERNIITYLKGLNMPPECVQWYILKPCDNDRNNRTLDSCLYTGRSDGEVPLGYEMYLNEEGRLMYKSEMDKVGKGWQLFAMRTTPEIAEIAAIPEHVANAAKTREYITVITIPYYRGTIWPQKKAHNAPRFEVTGYGPIGLHALPRDIECTHTMNAARAPQEFEQIPEVFKHGTVLKVPAPLNSLHEADKRAFDNAVGLCIDNNQWQRVLRGPLPPPYDDADYPEPAIVWEYLLRPMYDDDDEVHGGEKGRERRERGGSGGRVEIGFRCFVDKVCPKEYYSMWDLGRRN